MLLYPAGEEGGGETRGLVSLHSGPKVGTNDARGALAEE